MDYAGDEAELRARSTRQPRQHLRSPGWRRKLDRTPPRSASPKPRNCGASSRAEDLSRFLDFTPPATRSTRSLSGPSFLGLNGDAESLRVPSERAEAAGNGRAMLARGLMVARCGADGHARDIASRYRLSLCAGWGNLREFVEDAYKPLATRSVDPVPGPRQRNDPNFVVEHIRDPAKRLPTASPALRAPSYA